MTVRQWGGVIVLMVVVLGMVFATVVGVGEKGPGQVVALLFLGLLLMFVWGPFLALRSAVLHAFLGASNGLKIRTVFISPVGPVVPNVNFVLGKISKICITRQEPKQFVDNRF